jgi:HAD superfamily hydrolase (TIGR01549 family)
LAFVFDLDGTLVDSVYQHVLAWREALETAGIALAVWRIHRRIGMSGGLLVHTLLRETGHQVTAEEAARLQRLHAATYVREVRQVRLLPDARELLAYLSHAGVPWAIATSGRLETARPTLELLELSPDVPVITRDQVQHAKPDPDLFLAAADRLGVPISAAVVVGDSVWDLLAARRARALGVGLLSGGYGQEELERAGAYHVYQMAEQNMLSCAGGLAAGGKLPFVSTFGTFFIRAYDQVEMDFISRFPLKLVGSHVGVSLAADGPSQMALPDVTFFRAWTTVCTPDGKRCCICCSPPMRMRPMPSPWRWQNTTGHVICGRCGQTCHSFTATPPRFRSGDTMS